MKCSQFHIGAVLLDVRRFEGVPYALDLVAFMRLHSFLPRRRFRDHALKLSHAIGRPCKACCASLVYFHVLNSGRGVGLLPCA